MASKVLSEDEPSVDLVINKWLRKPAKRVFKTFFAGFFYYPRWKMLVLSRKTRESVIIGRESDLSILMRITVLEVVKGRVRLGFSSDTRIPIHRKEVWEKICGEILSEE